MSKEMHVAFITHGGATIGLGHVRRCLALAGSLATQGTKVRFLVGPDARLERLVADAGFPVDEVAWDVDAPAAARLLQRSGANVAVVDAYTATPELFEELRTTVERLVAIDDTADRRLPVDVVVNGSVGAEALAYRVARDTLLLLGPRYALIEPRYAAPPGRSPRDRVKRILVTLGGSVQAVAARAAVAAARDTASAAVVDVVLGPYALAASDVDGLGNRAESHVVIHGHVQELQPLMLQADLAITGAGMTLYELAATATPCVMVMTEPNQARNVEGFERARAAVFAAAAMSPDLQQALEEQLRWLVADAAMRVALGAAARRLVDGEGAFRVARELSRAFTPGN